ncbi:EAL domain-containing protein [Paenibacillus tarimensis]|uniref:EAL domain-containing protein n=1 Tax=Paenibacillus tarimensis TaxID=416012 RepID=UPI001F3FDAE2|nr:EAL domain-containing protein [Paenibacillus tarimensis]MCF2943117.1 EAL domain-containing protein [Paenibacillus tarimensis]
MYKPFRKATESQQSEQHNDGMVGVIYLGLKTGEEFQEPVYSIKSIPGWRQFADGALKNIPRQDVVIQAVRWIGDDLFVLLQRPGHPEEGFWEWLLELSRTIRSEWAEGWKAECASSLSYSDSAVLHAGISAYRASWNTEEDIQLRHNGMKRALVHGQHPMAIEQSLRKLALKNILGQDGLYPVYQPIISVQDGSCFGYEALTRLVDKSWFDGPLPLFKFAGEEGAVYCLDTLAREKAIQGFMAPGKQKIFINLTAHIMDDPRFTAGQTLQLLSSKGLSPSNVVFEITERTSIEDFGTAKRVLSHYRNQGYQIAIDDVGAGYSSLQSIVELRPDYIKIDRSLVQNIHQDEMKEQIMSTFVEFSGRMGISVVAEGIEQQEELDKVKAMGVGYAQGYLLGRPRSFAEDPATA